MPLHPKQLVQAVWPRYSRRIDFLNHNAKLAEWLREHQPQREFENARPMYEWLLTELAQGKPIDFLEFGVHQGDAIRFWTALQPHPDSRFVGFDSFEGLPEDWSLGLVTLKRGHFDVGGRIPSIDDRRVSFVKGWFNRTLPGFLASFDFKNLPIVRIDCDLHSSALYCLTMLDRHLPSKSIVLLDDFAGPLDVFRAWSDYTRAYGRAYRVLAARRPYYKEVAVELL